MSMLYTDPFGLSLEIIFMHMHLAGEDEILKMNL